MRPTPLSTEKNSCAMVHVGGLPNRLFLFRLADNLLPRIVPRFLWERLQRGANPVNKLPPKRDWADIQLWHNIAIGLAVVARTI
jgi:hypothetical protein